MKVTVPDYYKDFKCIAGVCEDTCCAGWQVDVDDASYAYYKTITGPFGDRLKSVMIDGKNGREGQFRICEDGRCPFLNDKNLCDLYTELGEDALCVTCDQYPRYTCEFGNYKETGIALSCKTAAELILKENRTPGFTESENEDSFNGLNNIDGLLYLNLKKAREKAYAIVWNREKNIWDRLAEFLDFAEGLQKCIKRPESIKAYIEGFKAPTKDETVLPENKEIKLYHQIWKCYMKQVIIKREWPQMVKTIQENHYLGAYDEQMKTFNKYYADREYEFENLITYFIFRYFMKAVFDKDVLTKVKMGVVSLLIIRQCDVGQFVANNGNLSSKEQVDICHLYSREVEHSEENFDNLCKIFSKKSIFKNSNLKVLLNKNKSY
jgi:lysine-N-methylase